jgi:hypothetical protein
VFEKLGGVDAMVKWANKNKTIFYASIFPRLLPLKISVDGQFRVTASDARRRLSNRIIDAMRAALAPPAICQMISIIHGRAI